MEQGESPVLFMCMGHNFFEQGCAFCALQSWHHRNKVVRNVSFRWPKIKLLLL